MLDLPSLSRIARSSAISYFAPIAWAIRQCRKAFLRVALLLQRRNERR